MTQNVQKIHKISIKNFGPVKKCIIALDYSFQILTGPQAAGKSTILKVIYLCLSLRKITENFLTDPVNFQLDDEMQNTGDVPSNEQNSHETLAPELTRKYIIKIRSVFESLFGDTRFSPEFKIQYRNDSMYFKVSKCKGSRLTVEFDSESMQQISSLILESSDIFQENLDVITSSFKDRKKLEIEMEYFFYSKLVSLFGKHPDPVYIPAGRNIFSILSGSSISLLQAKGEHLDYVTRQFIESIESLRLYLKNNLTNVADMIDDYEHLYPCPDRKESEYTVTELLHLISSLLKGEYKIIDGEERIYYNDKSWVTPSLASSGQQEVLWICMILMAMILQRRRRFILIEEPEAHLFPSAQKLLIQLIAMTINTTDSRAILTTHSPYVLSAANLYIYSGLIESNESNSQNDEFVVDSLYRIHHTNAYRLDPDADEYQRSIIDKELGLISIEYIDSVSDLLNDGIDKLIEKDIRP